jgi:N-ethylmaleimide reductase
MSILFTPFTLGPIVLQNRLVMAPMTRSRATGNIPNELMVDYYAQRSTAGLIITEGASSSPNGLGYPRIPGIFSAEQIEGWKAVTEATHRKGAKIFLQLMHCGCPRDCAFSRCRIRRDVYGCRGFETVSSA